MFSFDRIGSEKQNMAPAWNENDDIAEIAQGDDNSDLITSSAMPCLYACQVWKDLNDRPGPSDSFTSPKFRYSFLFRRPLAYEVPEAELLAVKPWILLYARLLSIKSRSGAHEIRAEVFVDCPEVSTPVPLMFL